MGRRDHGEVTRQRPPPEQCRARASRDGTYRRHGGNSRSERCSSSSPAMVLRVLPLRGVFSCPEPALLADLLPFVSIFAEPHTRIHHGCAAIAAHPRSPTNLKERVNGV